MNHEPPKPAEESESAVVLRFTEDHDDAHKERESEALLVKNIPRTGEIVAIDNQFHAVTQVVHNYDAHGIEIHLGPSRPTPEEAEKKSESP